MAKMIGLNEQSAGKFFNSLFKSRKDKKCLKRMVTASLKHIKYRVHYYKNFQILVYHPSFDFELMVGSDLSCPAFSVGKLDHRLLEHFIGKWDNEQTMQKAVYKLIEEENILFDAPLVFNK